MSAPDCRHTVIDSVRTLAFAGSEREVPLDLPLTEGGLGLDSLTIVELFTTLEASLGVPIFESEWIAAGDLTLASLIRYLEQQCGIAPAQRVVPRTIAPGRPEANGGSGRRVRRWFGRMRRGGSSTN